MFFAVALFLLVLAVIASERVDRTKVALIGATLVVLTQTLDQEGAIEAIDWNTIGLLTGMMVMVRLTEATGVFTWLAIRSGQWSGGRPLAVVLAFSVTTAVLSAFLDNVTTVLLVVPVTFLLPDALDRGTPVAILVYSAVVGLLCAALGALGVLVLRRPGAWRRPVAGEGP